MTTSGVSTDSSTTPLAASVALEQPDKSFWVQDQPVKDGNKESAVTHVKFDDLDAYLTESKNEASVLGLRWVVPTHVST